MIQSTNKMKDRQSNSLFKRLLLAIFLMTGTHFYAVAQGQKKINAYAASIVVAFNEKQTAASTFHQKSKTHWELRSPDSKTETLEEIMRDEWSIFLKDKNNVRLQIDLHDRAILKNNVKIYSINAWDAYTELNLGTEGAKWLPITDQTANRIIVSNFQDFSVQGGVYEYLGDESKQWKFSYIENNKLTGKETFHKEEERKDNVIALSNDDGYIVLMDLDQRVNKIMQLRDAAIANATMTDTISVFLFKTSAGDEHGEKYKKIGTNLWELTSTLNGKTIGNTTRLQEIGRSDKIIELEDIDGFETVFDFEKQKRSAMWRGQTSILGAYHFENR